ncbi:MAG: hypothetical protein DSY42_04740 [Aquifex sp.]|nr:MAG: hypothetical protein DSY42_04740 [Aquifex sp.]
MNTLLPQGHRGAWLTDVYCNNKVASHWRQDCAELGLTSLYDHLRRSQIIIYIIISNDTEKYLTADQCIYKSDFKYSTRDENCFFPIREKAKRVSINRQHVSLIYT